MAQIPDFIAHYMDQGIGEDCTRELLRIASQYEHDRNKIDTPERHAGDRRYKDLTGKQNPYSVAYELKNLREKCLAETKDIANSYAKNGGISLVDFEEKSLETDKTIIAKEVEEPVKEVSQKERQAAQASNNQGQSKEEQKKHLIEQMKGQSGKEKAIAKEQPQSENLNEGKELSEREKLIAQMKENSQSMTQKHERGI
ncbi:MAG: hypothetical protein U0U70_08060 [Chitinophagaceae bacterium]